MNNTGKIEKNVEKGVEKIERILEQEVRPALMAHEGDVVIESFRDGILRIRLTGRCSGCPSARLTTEELIEAKVREKSDEVLKVILVQEVSQELLDFAHEILHEREAMRERRL